MGNDCTKNHDNLLTLNSHNISFSNLPKDQRRTWETGNRQGLHLCAGCAYEQGKKDGKNHKSPNLDISRLPQGQASNQRHKHPYIAYVLGYQSGYLDNRPLN